MRQDERDVYVIPPNFIEGGTLMGGMIRTRNAIEAGVLGALTALPVLRLELSLTARIIILCLTTLPLVLVALIGIGGQSLSQFVFQFFIWLRNRRVLDQSGAGSKKGLLPSWAQKEHTANPDVEELPKSRRRFQVDMKKWEVSQHKTFLEREETVKPLNPLADYVPIDKIIHGVIKTRDRRYVKVVEVVPVNFLLRSAQEQRSIIYSFISYLKIAPVKVQFKVLTKRADIDRHVEGVREELARETDPHCRMLQEDYLRLIRDLGSREAITRRFFLIFEHEPMPGTKRGQEEEEAIASLQTAARTAANYLRQCGNTVLMPEEQDEAVAEILYHILCRRESNEHPFAEKAKRVVAEYLGAGREPDHILVNEFYAPAEIDFTHGRYLTSASLMMGIDIQYTDGIMEITLPSLLPKRKRRPSSEFLLDPFHAALSQYAREHPMPQFKHCVVCFSNIYDRELPERRVRDYDNLELKRLLDVAASFLLVDDSGLLCDAYHTTELGEADCTRISIMDSGRFADWLKEREKVLDSITDL